MAEDTEFGCEYRPIFKKMDSTGKLGGEFQQGLPECAIKYVRMRKVAF